MNCPKCGKEMMLGTIKGGSRIFWTPNPDKLLPWPGKKETVLYCPNDFGADAPPAWLCKDCKTVILEYK